MKLLAIALCAFAISAAQAQYIEDFEAPTYAGSAAGTPLTTGFGGGGQNGWYNPVAGSADFNVYTYAGNTLGFPANPAGGNQFMGSVGTAAPNNVARAQRDVDFSAGGVWTAQWDVIGAYRGTATAVENLGSFSLQNFATENFFQTLMQWGTNTTNPVAYNINYGVFAAAGGALTDALFFSPGLEWTNIPANHWIRQSTTWDFSTSKILSVSIQDLTAGTPMISVDVSGLGWFLSGGENNILAKPLPTGIRTFTGNVDNATGWDNFMIVPAPGAMAILSLGGLALARRRR